MTKISLNLYINQHKLKKDRILDLGCGGGYLTYKLSKLNETEGLTNSNVCLKFAQEKFPSCKFIKDKMEGFITESKYDIILALESICHTVDLHKTLKKNCYDNLKAKGRLYIKDMIYIDNPSPAAARNKTYDCYFYSLCPDYTVNNLFNLAKDVGFNVKYIQDLNKIYNKEYGESTSYRYRDRGQYKTLFTKEKYHENLAILFEKT